MGGVNIYLRVARGNNHRNRFVIGISSVTEVRHLSCARGRRLWGGGVPQISGVVCSPYECIALGDEVQPCSRCNCDSATAQCMVR